MRIFLQRVYPSQSYPEWCENQVHGTNRSQNQVPRFPQSLKALSMPLKALPKIFGLTELIKKEYFPQFFNRKENQCYVGPPPPIENYDPNAMTTK